MTSSPDRPHSISDGLERAEGPGAQDGPGDRETAPLSQQPAGLQARQPTFPAGPISLGLAKLQLWQGQFPPPEAIERYEKIQPGAFDRMISLVEASQAARAAGAQRGQDYAQADKRRGQWLGAATAWLAMVAAFACVALGGTSGKSGFFWVAAAFLSVPVMAVAKSLIESAKSPSIGQIPDVPGPPSDGSDG